MSGITFYDDGYTFGVSNDNLTEQHIKLQKIFKEDYVDVQSFEKQKQEIAMTMLKDVKLDANHVESTFNSPVIERDENGWLLPYTTPLKLSTDPNVKKYISIDGVSLDLATGQVKLQLKEASDPMNALFDDRDIREIVHRGISHAQFSLNSPDKTDRIHPFQQAVFSPVELMKNTSFLDMLLHCDYFLKMILNGVEVCGKQPFQQRPLNRDLVDPTNTNFLSRLPPSLREKLLDIPNRCRETNEVSSSVRVWIESDEIPFTEETNGAIISFKIANPPMLIKKKHHILQLVENNVVNSYFGGVDESKFKEKTSFELLTNEMSCHYDEIGQYFPEFLRLRELVKLCGISHILKIYYHKLVGDPDSIIVANLLNVKSQICGFLKCKSLPATTDTTVEEFVTRELASQKVPISKVSPQSLQALRSNIKQQLEVEQAKYYRQTMDLLVQKYSLPKSIESTLVVQLKSWLESDTESNKSALLSSLKNRNQLDSKALKMVKLLESEYGVTQQQDSPSASGLKPHTSDHQKDMGLMWVPTVFIRFNSTIKLQPPQTTLNHWTGGVVVSSNLKQMTTPLFNNYQSQCLAKDNLMNINFKNHFQLQSILSYIHFNNIDSRYKSKLGAGEKTSRSEKIPLGTNSIEASYKIAEKDRDRVLSLKDTFVQVSKSTLVPPEILAAIASRESHVGAILSPEGCSKDPTNKGFGIMQIDKQFHEPLGTKDSIEHITQAAQIINTFKETISKKHPNWTDLQISKGAIAAYNIGPKGVQTLENMDKGTTNDDYSGDVLVRADCIDYILTDYNKELISTLSLLPSLEELKLVISCRKSSSNGSKLFPRGSIPNTVTKVSLLVDDSIKDQYNYSGTIEQGTIPVSTEFVELNHLMFKYDPCGLLPVGLTDLKVHQFKYDCGEKTTKLFPMGLKKLYLGDTPMDGDLQPGCLPNSLVSLDFGKSLHKDNILLLPGVIPDGLLELRISFSTDNKETDAMISSFPKSIEKLVINCLKIKTSLQTISNGKKSLILEGSTFLKQELPPSGRFDQFNFPPFLQKLKINAFRIQNGSLPHSLKILHIKGVSKIKKGSLPQSITELTIKSIFFKLKPGVLPQNLKILLGNFSIINHENTLPDSIESLEYCPLCQENIKYLPKNLKHLKISGNVSLDITNFPETLESICFISPLHPTSLIQSLFTNSRLPNFKRILSHSINFLSIGFEDPYIYFYSENGNKEGYIKKSNITSTLDFL
eukprot:gene3216-4028_t